MHIKKSAGKDEDGHDIKVPDNEAIQLANTKIDEIRNGLRGVSCSNPGTSGVTRHIADGRNS